MLGEAILEFWEMVVIEECPFLKGNLESKWKLNQDDKKKLLSFVTCRNTGGTQPSSSRGEVRCGWRQECYELMV